MQGTADAGTHMTTWMKCISTEMCRDSFVIETTRKTYL